MNTILPPPIPPKGDLSKWAMTVTERLRILIDRQNRNYPHVIQLEHITPEAKAVQNGMLMWDEAEQCPVVSVGGVWRKVALV